MSVAVGVSVDQARIPISRERVAAVARAVLAAEGVRAALLSVTFVSDREIRRLNRAHLKRDRTTDVIAFALERVGTKAPILGDVYIAPGVARASAKANGVSLREEIVRLVVHGTLHVLGYEHPEGRGEARTRSTMWRKQERLVSKLAGGRAR
jgi:probable rRNA maturation factor